MLSGNYQSPLHSLSPLRKSKVLGGYKSQGKISGGYNSLMSISTFKTADSHYFEKN